MQKIVPFLWFVNNAEEAMNFYVSVFKDAEVNQVTHYSDDVPGPKGKVMSAVFTLRGQEFMVLNGGAIDGFTFSPATSFMVNCETQEDVDELWAKLSEGGKIMPCGWLTDKFGVTWQIVPTILGKLMNDPDAAKVQRVTKAMLQMQKLDIAALEAAANAA
jgi:predicted 3-demethylubiquinone-9 3-methyltransferase (glyoxalase superfamily)